jgi:hypothetical protein
VPSRHFAPMSLVRFTRTKSVVIGAFVCDDDDDDDDEEIVVCEASQSMTVKDSVINTTTNCTGSALIIMVMMRRRRGRRRKRRRRTNNGLFEIVLVASFVRSPQYLSKSPQSLSASRSHFSVQVRIYEYAYRMLNALQLSSCTDHDHVCPLPSNHMMLPHPPL